MGISEKVSQKNLDTRGAKKFRFFRESRYQWRLAKKFRKKSWILMGRKNYPFFAKPDTNGVSGKFFGKNADTNGVKKKVFFAKPDTNGDS